LFSSRIALRLDESDLRTWCPAAAPDAVTALGYDVAAALEEPDGQ
jgi:hypothetical protein